VRAAGSIGCTVPALCAALAFTAEAPAPPPDPLPSWNDGPAKKAILEFVFRVTDGNGKDDVPVPERIAVFDNDGTLWCEQPGYVQLFFEMDRARALAPDHPDWKINEPFRSAIAGDLRGVALSGEPGVLSLISATHAGVTPDEFRRLVREWIKTARHPVFNRPFTSVVYQPMLELLGWLRTRGFKTYIVSGGDGEFMRAFAEDLYGVPPEQVIGSSFELKLEMRGRDPVLVQQRRIDFIDDKEGKAIGIQKFIGRRPVMALGNSDGDLQMLQWTTAGPGPRFGLLVHHTDPQREYAYDRLSSVGRLDRALDEAPSRGWTVVDMRTDWRTIFPSALPPEVPSPN
jgi:phosphoserine phosphatase